MRLHATRFELDRLAVVRGRAGAAPLAFDLAEQRLPGSTVRRRCQVLPRLALRRPEPPGCELQAAVLEHDAGRRPDERFRVAGSAATAGIGRREKPFGVLDALGQAGVCGVEERLFYPFFADPLLQTLEHLRGV